MIKTINYNFGSDILGSAASSLCLIHCLATPFLFVAHTGQMQGHDAYPLWWGVLDLLFIGISLFAVYWSAKNTSKKWISYILWINWGFLAFVIINEKLGIIHLAETVIYIPSIALVVLHIYNRKYCQCSDDSCCGIN